MGLVDSQTSHARRTSDRDAIASCKTASCRVFDIRILVAAAVLYCGVLAGLAQAQPADDPAAPADEASSPLLDEPTTPAELLNAADLMVRFGRPQLARRYIQQLLDQEPSDQTLLELSDQYGPALFLKLSNIQSLRPASTDLLERVTQAFRETGASAERIDGLIDQLGAAPRDREIAIRSLQSLGAVVVPRFLARLNDPKSVDEHDRLIDALARIGRQAVPPLLAALQTPSTKLRADVIQSLGWIEGTREAVPYLWYPAFATNEPPEVQVSARHALRRIQGRNANVDVSPYGVAEALRDKALAQYRYEHPWALEDDGSVDFWIWDDKTQNVVRENISPNVASLLTGLRFARQALSLAPNRPDIQALYLGLTLAEARQQAGWNAPLPAGPATAHDLALTAGTEAVADTLKLALESGNSAAAVGALEVLGRIGAGETSLLSATPSSPVLAALDFPDRRVQFAAAECVLRLNPSEPFPGSDRIVPVLARALNGSTAPAAIVVDASTPRGNQVAALITELGFFTEATTTGREGFRLASERGDVQLVLLEINTIRWPLSMTVANLRADARTANIPIVIYGPQEMRSRVTSLLQRYPNIVYAIEATGSEEFDAQLRPYLQKWRQAEPTEEQRARQMEAAAFWLADIASSGDDVFNLAAAKDALIGTSSDPLLAENVLLALSEIPSNEVQATLEQLAVSDSFEAPIRIEAARHLAHHIQQFGLLLSREEIAGLKATWESADDPGLASALATVLGSLKPNTKQVGMRLQDFTTQPAAPPAAP